jgi:hypothetical protein
VLVRVVGKQINSVPKVLQFLLSSWYIRLEYKYQNGKGAGLGLDEMVRVVDKELGAKEVRRQPKHFAAKVDHGEAIPVCTAT